MLTNANSWPPVFAGQVDCSQPSGDTYESRLRAIGLPVADRPVAASPSFSVFSVDGPSGEEVHASNAVMLAFARPVADFAVPVN